MDKIRDERARFISELSQIKGLKVIPSQANYVMVELKNDVTARGLTKILLNHYNVFVKDLSSKIKNRQLLRLAVRDTTDNNKLLEALRCELN